MKLGRKAAVDEEEVVPIIAPKVKKKPPPEKEIRHTGSDDDILGFIIPNSPKLSMAILGGLVLMSSLVGLWAMGTFTSPTSTVPVPMPKATGQLTPNKTTRAKVTTPAPEAIEPTPIDSIVREGGDEKEAPSKETERFENEGKPVSTGDEVDKGTDNETPPTPSEEKVAPPIKEETTPAKEETPTPKPEIKVEEKPQSKPEPVNGADSESSATKPTEQADPAKEREEKPLEKPTEKPVEKKEEAPLPTTPPSDSKVDSKEPAKPAGESQETKPVEKPQSEAAEKKPEAHFRQLLPPGACRNAGAEEPTRCYWKMAPGQNEKAQCEQLCTDDRSCNSYQVNMRGMCITYTDAPCPNAEHVSGASQPVTQTAADPVWVCYSKEAQPSSSGASVSSTNIDSKPPSTEKAEAASTEKTEARYRQFLPAGACRNAAGDEPTRCYWKMAPGKDEKAQCEQLCTDDGICNAYQVNMRGMCITYTDSLCPNAEHVSGASQPVTQTASDPVWVCYNKLEATPSTKTPASNEQVVSKAPAEGGGVASPTAAPVVIP